MNGPTVSDVEAVVLEVIEPDVLVDGDATGVVAAPPPHALTVAARNVNARAVRIEGIAKPTNFIPEQVCETVKRP